MTQQQQPTTKRDHVRMVVEQMEQYTRPDDLLVPTASTVTLQTWIAKLRLALDPPSEDQAEQDATAEEVEAIIRQILMRQSHGLAPQEVLNELEAVQFNAFVTNLIRLSNGIPRSVAILGLLLHLKNAVGPLSNYKRAPGDPPGRDWADACMMMISKMGDQIMAIKGGQAPDK